MLVGDFRPGFKVWQQQKDLRLALEAGDGLQVPLPIASLLRRFRGAGNSTATS